MTIAAAEEGRLPRLGRTAESELERLYGRHAGEVRRYVQLVLRNRNDAEDVVQQTFLKALRALQQGVRPEKPRQWLVAIAHNECRMLFRQSARRPVEVDLDTVGEITARSESGMSAESIREALDQLAPKQRAALVMRELDDRSYAEIATALQLTESAVETLLFRARRALREQLESAGGGCEDAQLLLAAGSLDDASRKRLRAHVRTCQACATLERRRRGKLAAAARKVAGLFPTPSWLSSLLGGGGAKAVVAIAAAAVAVTGGVEVAKTNSAKQPPKPAPALAHRDAILRTVVAPQFASSLTQLQTAQAAVAATASRTGSAAAKRFAAGTDGTKGAAAANAVDDHLAPSDGAASTSATSTVRPATAAGTSTAAQPARTAQPDVIGTVSEPSSATSTLPSLPSLPSASLPPLPTVDPSQVPAAPSLPQPPPLPEAPTAPATPQLPPTPEAPTVSVPSVQPPPVPTAPAPSTPTLTKP